MGIVAEDVGQDVVTLVPGKVEVDVGRVPPLGVEEALEQEPRAERLDVGDAEAVAHDRVGHRAAAAVGGAVLDDVVHHQEIVGEALHPDDAELVLQPVPRHRRHGAVAPHGAGVGQRAELLKRVARVGETRRHHAAERDPVRAALGDLGGGAHGLGAVRELAREVVGRAEPGVAGGDEGRIERREGGVGVDGAEQPVAAPVFGVRHDDGVGDGGGKPQTPRRGQHGMAFLAGAELGVEVARAAQTEDALEEGGVPGEEDEAVAVGGETGGQAVGRTGGRVDRGAGSRLTA